ncbi:DUF6049 family protein [Saccharopolyspora cebuensis]|uniref:DUF6049 family protein n=1 Tax=Saccharopolyspora cebuensis TaxID=418759 RepID=A0ABV4CPU7_9PSEU
MRFLLVAVIAALGMAATVLPGVVPGTAPRAHAQDAPLTRLEVTNVTPSVVQGNSPGELVVTGRLTNISDRTISGVEARIERGNPAATEAEAQRALRAGSRSATGPAFRPVVDELSPGQVLPIELRIPLTGPNSLQLTQPGVYPLLVNINGVPEAGGRARVAEAQFLLPVLALPGGAPAAPPPQPTPMSMLVPIVDYPRMEREALPNARGILVDDQLSTSLAPGGRLYELVQAVSETAPPGSPLGNGLCFAIDPDLLMTVRTMQAGYLVRQDDGTLAEGIGSSAAELWLSKLREATNGRCVIALPYADVDVVALGRADLPDLVTGAMEGRALVRGELGTEPREVMWPVEGALDGPAVEQMPRTVLMQPEAIGIPAGSLSPARVRGADIAAVPIDPLLSRALDPLHDTPQRVTALSPPENGRLSAQNVLGALTVRATTARVPNATSVLAPPRRWRMGGDDLRGLLRGMQDLSEAGYVEPTALPTPDPASLPEADLTYPVDAGADEIPQPVLDALAAQNYKVGDLYRSSDNEPSSQVQPGHVTTPLRNGLLRGASSAWRGDPDAARHWVRLATRTLEGVLSQVRIGAFPGTIMMGSNTSHVPITVINDLPIQLRVELVLPRLPGVEYRELGVLRIPANGKRTFWLETSAQRPGKFFIDVGLVTEGGTRLSSGARMPVQSTAYGAVIPIITAIAGALLVGLSVRRIVRKVRAKRRDERTGGGTDQSGPVDAAVPAATDGDRDAD